MTKQTELMLVKEFSEKELESISGGALVTVVAADVIDVNRNRIEILNNNDVDANVAVAVLSGVSQRLRG